MSRVIETQVKAQKRKAQDRIKEARENRQNNYRRPKLHLPLPQPSMNENSPTKRNYTEKFTLESAKTYLRTIGKMLSAKTAYSGITWDNGRMIVKHPLGQFLLDAAHLHEAIYLYRDQKIFEKYMSGKTVLHPRRTLDQYYYGTLHNTHIRDRDQVVYRGTTRNAERAHKFQETGGRKGSLHIVPHSPENKCICDGEALKWSGHTSVEDDNACSYCKSDVQKVSRVIMVDQLWMWVLDENTIITSFPKRYGFNKKDPSGVHKCIRDRLKTMAADDMKSVYNLALVVLDECSYTFFDRTRTEASEASPRHFMWMAS